MKIKAFFLTLFLSVCFSVSSQETSFQENIISYLKLNGTEQQYSAAYDQMFEVLKSQFEAGSVPDEVWSTLQEGKSGEVQKVLALLSSAYRQHFTKEEIKGMLQFYQSEAGKQFVRNAQGLNEMQNKEVGAFFKGPYGMRIEEVRNQLTIDISQISEYWSRDLFNSTFNTLKEKGYNPKT